MRKNFNSRRPNQYSGNRSNLNPKAIAITAVALLMLFVLWTMNHKAEVAHGKIDSTTSCTKGTSPQVTVILIDQTDHFNAIQKQDLETELWDVANSIPVHSVLKLYLIKKVNDNILKPEISLCKPETDNDVSEMTGNKQMAAKRFKQQFQDPLQEILNLTFADKAADKSPIMEAIQAVSVTSFIGNSKNDTSKKLILVSDLLQHTSEFSVYKNTPNFDALKKSSYWKSAKSDLESVEVDILFLHRKSADHLQTSALRTLWKKIFEAQGAIINRFHPVPG